MTKAKPVGEGCIEGMRCPKCGEYQNFFIEGTSMFRVLEDGTDSYSDVEWDDDSACACPSCAHHGTVRDFHPGARKPRPKKETEADRKAFWKALGTSKDLKVNERRLAKVAKEILGDAEHCTSYKEEITLLVRRLMEVGRIF